MAVNTSESGCYNSADASRDKGEKVDIKALQARLAHCINETPPLDDAWRVDFLYEPSKATIRLFVYMDGVFSAEARRLPPNTYPLALLTNTGRIFEWVSAEVKAGSLKLGDSELTVAYWAQKYALPLFEQSAECTNSDIFLPGVNLYQPPRPGDVSPANLWRSLLHVTDWPCLPPGGVSADAPLFEVVYVPTPPSPPQIHHFARLSTGWNLFTQKPRRFQEIVDEIKFWLMFSECIIEY